MAIFVPMGAPKGASARECFTIQYVDFYANRKFVTFESRETAERRLADMARRPADYRKARIVDGYAPVQQNAQWW